MIRELLGVTLEELDGAWTRWVLSRFAAFDRAEQLAADYRRRIQGAHICVAGIDY